MRDSIGESLRVGVIGAGPAGLTAAYELGRRDAPHSLTIIEADSIVGGIARTESHNGFRFDIGGHRFFTKVSEVEEMWHEVMGDDFIVVPRLSRIYYRGKFYAYPLQVINALSNIGPYEAARIMLSYAKWQVRPKQQEETFEDWVINRFGGRLYMHFFRSYTEKVWGISPRKIQADWAAQRIKNLSLFKAVLNAMTGFNNTTSLIEKFHYPRLGPGMMWEKVADHVVAKGADLHMNTRVVRVRHAEGRVTEMETEGPDGARKVTPVDHLISSMALRDLILCMDPAPPDEVCAAAQMLNYRDFLIVTLVLDHPDPFPDNWIYIHSPEVHVGRIQNFRAWSQEMTPNDNQASIGMEYFCHVGDGLWEMSDEALIAMAGHELEKLGLAAASSVVDGAIIRQPKAYPVYDPNYRTALAVIREWLDSLGNIQCVGRNGQHRYNNQDHSMLTAMLAARNLCGEAHDIWEVNVERSYHEEFERKREEAEAAA